MLIPKYWAQFKQRFDKLESSDLETSGENKRQATIKRYGWSDISQADALMHAKARVADAHSRWLAGEDIVRRERKERYNEINGIPIREQILSNRSLAERSLSKSSLPKTSLPKSSAESTASDTQLIVTRNSYGAQVANVNNIAIIDVDNIDLFRHLHPNDYSSHDFMGITPKTVIGAKQSNATSVSSSANIKSQSGSLHKSSSMKPQVWGFVILSIIIASVIAWQSLSWIWLIAFMLMGTAFLWWQARQKEQVQQQAHKQRMAAHLAKHLSFMTDLMQKRIASHPNERFRLYETPAGFRIIATHDTVLPNDNAVAEWFKYFHADANYARLCQVQQCFRARLTAKPWRMTEVTEQHTLDNDVPNKDFWFTDVGPDTSFDKTSEVEQKQANLVARHQWIKDYDKFAKGYKACRYVESFYGREVKGKEVVGSNDNSTQATISAFVHWHDSACQVDKDLPMA